MSKGSDAVMTNPDSAVPAPGDLVAPGAARSGRGEPYLDEAGQVRVRPGATTAADVGTVAGAAAGALGLVWLLYERILPFTGALGFWLCWYATFLCLYWGIARTQWEARHVREKLAAAMLTGAGLLVLAVLADQIGYVFWRGSNALGRGNFLHTDMRKTGPLDGLNSGGVLHAMIG